MRGIIKKISIVFLGNIDYDTRTFNLVQSFKEKGHAVQFLGFDWSTPGFKTRRHDSISVIKLKKTKFSLLFYFKFIVRLMHYVLSHKAHVYIASDIYTLPVCVLAGWLYTSEVIYDSREVYTGLPAFVRRKWLVSVVYFIEMICLKRVQWILTTGKLDSEYLRKKYHVKRIVELRNLPLVRNRVESMNYRQYRSYPQFKRYLVYQGLLVPGRGIETAFKVLKGCPEYGLVLLGGGELDFHYIQMAEDQGISQQVLFMGRIPQDQLLRYTQGADIGLSLIENTSTNSYYALPNKLFEYIMAELPVIVTHLPQMKQIVDRYDVGASVPENDPDSVIRILKEWEADTHQFKRMKINCSSASKVLNWNNEFNSVYSILFEKTGGTAHV